jgi:hypothetical protein
VFVSDRGVHNSSENIEKLETLAVVLGWLWDVPRNYNQNRGNYAKVGILAAYFDHNVYQSAL